MEILRTDAIREKIFRSFIDISGLDICKDKYNINDFAFGKYDKCLESVLNELKEEDIYEEALQVILCDFYSNNCDDQVLALIKEIRDENEEAAQYDQDDEENDEEKEVYLLDSITITTDSEVVNLSEEYVEGIDALLTLMIEMDDLEQLLAYLEAFNSSGLLKVALSDCLYNKIQDELSPEDTCVYEDYFIAMIHPSHMGVLRKYIDSDVKMFAIAQKAISMFCETELLCMVEAVFYDCIYAQGADIKTAIMKAYTQYLAVIATYSKHSKILYADMYCDLYLTLGTAHRYEEITKKEITSQADRAIWLTLLDKNTDLEKFIYLVESKEMRIFIFATWLHSSLRHRDISKEVPEVVALLSDYVADELLPNLLGENDVTFA